MYLIAHHSIINWLASLSSIKGSTNWINIYLLYLFWRMTIQLSVYQWFCLNHKHKDAFEMTLFWMPTNQLLLYEADPYWMYHLIWK